jgi:pilus assembly protein CpaC
MKPFSSPSLISPSLPLAMRSSARCAFALGLGFALSATEALSADRNPAPAKQFGGVPYEVVPSPRIQPNSADALVARRFDLSVGKSVMVDLPSDAGEVFVADPKIANAVVRTARKIFIIGIATGTTSIFVMDKAGAQIAALDIGVSKELARELSIIREVLKKAMPNANITVSSVGDSFVLAGTVDSALEAQGAVDMANNLVGQSGGGAAGTAGKVVNALQVRGRDQVMLKVTVAEIQRTVLKQLGINFDGQWQASQALLGLVSQNPLSVNGELSQTAITGRFGGNKTGVMRTLERQGMMRTLAEPTLTAISGESAKFMAGGEIPLPTGETCDTTTARCTVTIGYKPVGVSLNFTPVVLSENRISIRVSTEVTEIDTENSVRLSSLSVPGLRTRKAETTVELPSGGVLATAGLIQQQSRQQINGLPGLMNVPVLGTLFRSRDYQRFETELVVLVQPFIAKPSAPGAIARPDDGFADPTDPSAIFMGRLNRTYGTSAATRGQAGPVGFIND